MLYQLNLNHIYLFHLNVIYYFTYHLFFELLFFLISDKILRVLISKPTHILFPLEIQKSLLSHPLDLFFDILLPKSLININESYYKKHETIIFSSILLIYIQYKYKFNKFLYSLYAICIILPNINYF